MSAHRAQTGGKYTQNYFAAYMAHLFRQYWFWLVAVSLVVMLLERIRPWRREQKWLRPQLGQDLFWLVFNGYVWGIVAGAVLGALPWFDAGSLRGALDSFKGQFATVAAWPFAAQVVVYLVLADFVEWWVHNALHRLNWLWPIHRVHHSIHTMDWIGNFRFHWGSLLCTAWSSTFHWRCWALATNRCWSRG